MSAFFLNCILKTQHAQHVQLYQPSINLFTEFIIEGTWSYFTFSTEFLLLRVVLFHLV